MSGIGIDTVAGSLDGGADETARAVLPEDLLGAASPVGGRDQGEGEADGVRLTQRAPAMSLFHSVILLDPAYLGSDCFFGKVADVHCAGHSLLVFIDCMRTAHDLF